MSYWAQLIDSRSLLRLQHTKELRRKGKEKYTLNPQSVVLEEPVAKRKSKKKVIQKSLRTSRPEIKTVIWLKSHLDLLQEAEPAGSWQKGP